MATADKKLKIEALRPSDFGLVSHKITQFDANVSGVLKKIDLEDPDLWVNVANKMIMGSEVRCLADDMSFVAYGICTFAQGSTAKIKIISMHKLDVVSTETSATELSGYEIKLRGPKKWCLIKQSTGEIIKEGIATSTFAMKEMEDYVKALRS